MALLLCVGNLYLALVSRPLEAAWQWCELQKRRLKALDALVRDGQAL